jgi:hypothetical protein
VDKFLDGFGQEMRKVEAAGFDGEKVAVRLYDHLRADREVFQVLIADVQQWACNVEIELTTGAMWTVECLGADAYHFYPAHIGDDGSVVWLNVWVADDMTLDQTIAQITTEVLG